MAKLQKIGNLDKIGQFFKFRLDKIGFFNYDRR